MNTFRRGDGVRVKDNGRKRLSYLSTSTLNAFNSIEWEGTYERCDDGELFPHIVIFFNEEFLMMQRWVGFKENELERIK